MAKKRNTAWFEVDKEGLAKLLEGRGKIALIHELIQNGWDTDSKRVEVTLVPLEGRPLARLEVRDDDPNGFADLSHAYTLFAESGKKTDPSKRGRFNLGEKLVLALCDEATVSSTTGTVMFCRGGERRNLHRKSGAGSVFAATIRMTRAELDEIDTLIDRLIPPDGVVTTFNGRVIEGRTPVVVFTTSLPTVIGDQQGVLRRSRRCCEVAVYRTREEEPGFIYEMGIPVVETGDRFDVDVRQKVPLNMDRDNITPGFLRELRAAVLNAMHSHEAMAMIETHHDAWVTDALCHKEVSAEAVRRVIRARFGDKAVAYDPSDREANHQAAADDATVVHGGSLPKEAWANVRHAKVLVPAGQIYPSTPSSSVAARMLRKAEWTEGMRRVAECCRRLAAHLLEVHDLEVQVFEAPGATTMADYERQRRRLRFNVGHPLMGPEWFDANGPEDCARIVDLIVHELGHHLEDSHLSERYHEALTMMAGRIAAMTLGRGTTLFKDLLAVEVGSGAPGTAA